MTYLPHDEGKIVNSESYFLRFPHKPDARIIALRAYLSDSDLATEMDRQLSGQHQGGSGPRVGLPSAE
jgi:hypothetical protein